MSRRRLAQRVKLKSDVVWELMNRRNMSQNELARRTQITSGYLSQLMTGSRSPSPEVRKRIQTALGARRFDQLFILEHVDD